MLWCIFRITCPMEMSFTKLSLILSNTVSPASASVVASLMSSALCIAGVQRRAQRWRVQCGVALASSTQRDAPARILFPAARLRHQQNHQRVVSAAAARSRRLSLRHLALGSHRKRSGYVRLAVRNVATHEHCSASDAANVEQDFVGGARMSSDRKVREYLRRESTVNVSRSFFVSESRRASQS